MLLTINPQSKLAITFLQFFSQQYTNNESERKNVSHYFTCNKFLEFQFHLQLYAILF